MSAETILLVDDDEVLSQVLRRVLTRDPHAQAALLDLDFGEPGFVEQRCECAHDPLIVGALGGRVAVVVHDCAFVPSKAARPVMARA